MNIIKYQDDIWAYENFLTKKECDGIIKSVHMQIDRGDHEWRVISFYESATSGYPHDGHPDLEASGLTATFFPDLKERVKAATAAMAGKTPEQMSNIGFHFQKWEKGAFAWFHSDNSANDGTKTAFERSRYASFIYLNDDFEGGVLNFKANYGENEFTIVPKMGMLVTFHGGHKNLHEVTKITNGTRYTMGSFWDDKEYEDYPQEIRDKWSEELAKIRAEQAVQINEWQEIKDSGYRMNPDGTRYKVDDE